MNAVKAKFKIWKRKQINPLNKISTVYFLQTRLFTEKNSRTSTSYPGISSGRTGHSGMCDVSSFGWKCLSADEQYLVTQSI